MLLGKYFVQIKDAHIHWGERRKQGKFVRKNHILRYQLAMRMNIILEKVKCINVQLIMDRYMN